MKKAKQISAIEISDQQDSVPFIFQCDNVAREEAIPVVASADADTEVIIG